MSFVTPPVTWCSATQTIWRTNSEYEIVHFAALIQSLIDANVFEVTHTFETYIFLQLNENNLNETFPNVNIMLKIYLCMFVANCKGERSFSKLKFELLAQHYGSDKAYFSRSPFDGKQHITKA